MSALNTCVASVSETNKRAAIEGRGLTLLVHVIIKKMLRYFRDGTFFIIVVRVALATLASNCEVTSATPYIYSNFL